MTGCPAVQRSRYSSRKLVQESDGSRVGEKFLKPNRMLFGSLHAPNRVGHSGVQSFIFLLSRLEELHNKQQYGGKSNAAVYDTHYACHWTLFALYCIELEANNDDETEDLSDAADAIFHRHWQAPCTA